MVQNPNNQSQSMTEYLKIEEEVLHGLDEAILEVNESITDDFTDHAEFFHNKDEYGISELNGCKYLLFRTIGDSGVKLWDILCFVPSLLFLLFLIYSYPRSRQKLNGAPLPFVAVHILLFLTTTVSSVRCLLMLMAPSPNDDKLAANLEKITWSFTHAATLCLELTALVIFVMPTLPTNKASKRIVIVIGILSFCFGFMLSIIELRSPAKEFHVYQFTTDLFGDGGGVCMVIFSLLSAISYASLISLRCLQQKGSQRSSTFTFCTVMLGVQGTRTFGAILLANDIEFGMCVTNFTFYLLVEFLPPFVFMCVLSPYLQNRQGHSLLSQGYHTTESDWLEEDTVGFSQRNDPIGILRRDETMINGDDYEL